MSDKEELYIEEELYNIVIGRAENKFIIKIQSEVGGDKEFSSRSFEEVLEQLFQDLQEESESF